MPDEVIVVPVLLIVQEELRVESHFSLKQVCSYFGQLSSLLDNMDVEYKFSEQVSDFGLRLTRPFVWVTMAKLI